MMKGKKITALLLAIVQAVAIMSLTGCNNDPVVDGGSSDDVLSIDTNVSADYNFEVSGSVTQIGDGKEITSEQVITSVIPGTPGRDQQTAIKYKLIEGDFCLAKNGKATCTIVMEENCNPKVYNAAYDLADNLQAMVGVEFPVVEAKAKGPNIEGNKIFMGKSSFTDKLGISIPEGYPNNEGYVVISSKNIMVLAGNDDGAYNGTGFAVTALLESLGFGWFAEDDIWNVVPKAKTVYVPFCNVLSKPSFASRYNWVLAGIEGSNPIIGKRWYLGGEPTEVNHKFGAICSASEYGLSNEVYALVNGQRTIEGKVWWQLCLSNPKVQQAAIAHVKKFFKENPDHSGVSIGQNDGNGGKGDPDYGNFCECDNCKKMGDSFTIQLIKFANIVARGVKKDYPNKTLMIYAYESTFNAPSYERLGEKIEDNVLIMFGRHGGMTKYIKNNDSWDESKNLSITKSCGTLFNNGAMEIMKTATTNFLNWKKLGGQIAVYEWNCPGGGAYGDRWRNSFWVPGKAFTDNARWFKQNGTKFIHLDQGPNGGVYESATFDCFELRWSQWYVSSKSMWNCTLTFDEIMKGACERLYGDAAETMFKFYSTLADASDASAKYFHHEWSLPQGSDMYRNYRGTIDSLIGQARTQGAAIGGDVQKRIENQYQYWTLTKSQWGL